MEQHPIPQNVTTFQFKLVGDITLKQFAYLAANILVAYLVTKISFIPVFLSYPLAALFVFLGIGLAFIPVQQRPLDRWLTAFIKSIYSPTQYIYKKNNPPPEVLTSIVANYKPVVPPPPKPVQKGVAQEFMTSMKSSKLPPISSQVTTSTIISPTGLSSQPKKIISQPVPLNKWTIGAPPVKSVQSQNAPIAPSASVTGKKVVFENKTVLPNPSSPAPSSKDVEKIKADYQKEAEKLTSRIDSLQVGLKEGNIAKERLIEFQQVLAQLAAEKETMSRKILELQKQLANKPDGEFEKPTTFVQTKRDTQTTVKIVPSQAASQAGIPKLTNQTNVITGIIKNSQGALLPNIIITVKDKESVPVRAFKTNRLGQFAASTPLPSGVYIIEIEDPKKSYQFHRIEITLTDQVLPPLEISAVSERDIVRQKLSQELFGGNKI